jgi:hypothetical protein
MNCHTFTPAQLYTAAHDFAVRRIGRAPCSTLSTVFTDSALPTGESEVSIFSCVVVRVVTLGPSVLAAASVHHHALSATVGALGGGSSAASLQKSAIISRPFYRTATLSLRRRRRRRRRSSSGSGRFSRQRTLCPLRRTSIKRRTQLQHGIRRNS